MDEFKQDLRNIDKKRLYQSLFVLFLLITIPVGVRLAGQVQVFAPKAQNSDNIQALTNQLLAAKKDYEQPGIFERIGIIAADPEDKIARMVSTATIRKEALEKEAMDNPEAFLFHAVLADQKTSFPPAVQPLLEERKQVTGELTVLHADDFENKKSTYLYKLKEGENLYNVTFAGEAPEVLTGSIVEVNGIGINKDVVAGGGEPQPPTPIPPPFRIHFPVQPILENTTGIQKTAVILVNFDNDRGEPVDAGQVRQIMFGQTGNSAFAYYQENSYNKTFFQGEVFGWFTIPGTQECRIDDWAVQADELAQSAGADIASYLRRVYVFPATSPCAWSGLAVVGGIP